MQTIAHISARIVKDVHPQIPEDQRVHQESVVFYHIKYMLEDIFKLLKNIQDTSLGDADRSQRIQELQTRYGVPVKNLL